MEIKDYLHLYLGCEAIMTTDHWFIAEGELRVKITGVAVFNPGGAYVFYSRDSAKGNERMQYFKPILRRLSSMTEEEKMWIASIWNAPWPTAEYNPVIPVQPEGYAPSIFGCAEITRDLCKRGYDLFGLIDAGLAIEQQS